MRIPDRLDIRIGDKLMISLQSADDDSDFWLHKDPPCPMLENPEKLQQMVHETGAKSTDLQSPESVEHLCGKCEQYASIWKKKADELWEKSGKAEKEEKKA